MTCLLVQSLLPGLALRLVTLLLGHVLGLGGAGVGVEGSELGVMAALVDGLDGELLLSLARGVSDKTCRGVQGICICLRLTSFCWGLSEGMVMVLRGGKVVFCLDVGVDGDDVEKDVKYGKDKIREEESLVGLYTS